MKNRLLIVGAGGHGRVVFDVALKMNKWQNIAFLDDRIINVSYGLEVIGKSIEAEYYIEDYDIFVAIGNNTVREKFLDPTGFKRRAGGVNARQAAPCGMAAGGFHLMHAHLRVARILPSPDR